MHQREYHLQQRPLFYSTVVNLARLGVFRQLRTLDITKFDGVDQVVAGCPRLEKLSLDFWPLAYAAQHLPK
jgi:hypothetical protein